MVVVVAAAAAAAAVAVVVVVVVVAVAVLFLFLLLLLLLLFVSAVHFTAFRNSSVHAERDTGRLLHGNLRSVGRETVDRFLRVRVPAVLGFPAAQQTLPHQQHHAPESDHRLHASI